MSKKLVVDAEWLLELLPENYPFPPQTVEQMIQEQEDYTLDGTEVIRPLTPAQERAGDEEWVVVRKQNLFAHLERTYCIGCPVNEQECPNATIARGVVYVEARFRKECLQRQMDALTTPGAEKGGRA